MKRLTLIMAIVAVTAFAGAADARFLETHAGAMELNYTAGTGQIKITETAYTIFDILLKEGSPTNVGAVVDQARLVNDGSSFEYDLTMNLQQMGANDWDATSGTLDVSDTDTSTSAISAANFKSTSISLAGNLLRIDGLIWVTNPATETILVNRGDPWVYQGNVSQTPDGDDDVTVTYNVDEYDTGNVMVIYFSLPGNVTDLDDFLSADRVIGDGQVKMNIVPVPAAMILGLVGLGLVGRIKRRFA